jgi:exopolyphosphatase/guanosine-5'-triphosphate,3'-diphosphate pyrophosphatase
MPVAETPAATQVVAVIDIGSSAIRMVVAELGPKLAIRYLENLQKPAPLGKDVFTTGRLSHRVIREAIDILKNYKDIADSYGVKHLRAIATSAVREASNRDNFVDQVFVRTAIDVEIIEGAEENRLDLIAVEHAMEGKLDFDKKNCMIIEVGTGSTEIIYTTQGQVALTRTLPMGPIRLPEQSSTGRTDAGTLQRLIRRNTHIAAEEVKREFALETVDTYIALGANMRFLVKMTDEKTDNKLAVLPAKALQEFIKTVAKMTPEEIVDVWGFSYSDAEVLYPSLLIYASFLDETKAAEVLVPMVSIRDGLLLEIAQLLLGPRRTDLTRQVINSAKALGQKYRYDEAHAANVSALAVKLFDQLKEDHGLGPRERLLLEVAGILHDIGTFIAPQAHHRHSSYLIDAADIFGLRKADKDIVSKVALYHRRQVPGPTDPEYMSLSRHDRAVVSKLAAIIRVAEALDKSHQQKIRDFTLERDRDMIIIRPVGDPIDLSMERQALAKKDSLFTDVLGATLVLKQEAAART